MKRVMLLEELQPALLKFNIVLVAVTGCSTQAMLAQSQRKYSTGIIPAVSDVGLCNR